MKVKPFFLGMKSNYLVSFRILKITYNPKKNSNISVEVSSGR